MTSVRPRFHPRYSPDGTEVRYSKYPVLIHVVIIYLCTKLHQNWSSHFGAKAQYTNKETTFRFYIFVEIFMQQFIPTYITAQYYSYGQLVIYGLIYGQLQVFYVVLVIYICTQTDHWIESFIFKNLNLYLIQIHSVVSVSSFSKAKPR